jgi:hypothetical protein
MNISSSPLCSTTLRRLGMAAFLFFLLKGVLWLAAPVVFIWLI